MMYLKCKRMNGKRCDFVARGKTSWEVKKSMLDHYASEHKGILLDTNKEDRRNIIDSMDRFIDNNKKRTISAYYAF